MEVEVVVDAGIDVEVECVEARREMDLAVECGSGTWKQDVKG